MEDCIHRETTTNGSMKHFCIICVFVYLLSCFALVCASCGAGASAEVVPATLTRTQQTSFRTIAQKLANPCHEEDLIEYKNFMALLESGKACRESIILLEELTLFLSHGVDDTEAAQMIRQEAQQLQTPYRFNLDGRPRLGPVDAPVEIVIFSDFQCPYCARAAAGMNQIVGAYPRDVSIVFKHLPLFNIHEYAAAAAVVTVYAQSQGKFWPIHDAFFQNQSKLTLDFITATLESLGASVADVFDPKRGQAYGVTIIEDIKDAQQAKVAGTPTIFLNGVEIVAGANVERLMARIDLELRASGGKRPVALRTKRHSGQSLCDYPDLKIKCLSLSEEQQQILQLCTNMASCPCQGKSADSLGACARAASCVQAREGVDDLIEKLLNGATKADLLREIGASP